MESELDVAKEIQMSMVPMTWPAFPDRDDIDMFLSEKKYSLREEVSNFADYYEVRKNEYLCELKVVERDTPVIEIRLSVPSEDNARTVCSHWRQKNADIYAYVINVLLGDTPSGKTDQ